MTKTLFIGTSDFAVPIIKKLTELNYINLVGVITQPDKPVGRKQILTPPPVKQFLLNNKIKVETFQPIKLKKDAKKILDKIKPELIIVASYGQFIPKIMLDYPKYKCLNVHISLLPDLRGAVPMPMAILRGYEKTGVSIQIMTEGMDEGDLIGEKEIEIDDKETTETLTKKSSNAGAELLEEILPKWISGQIEPKPQDHNKATYCYQKDIAKENAEIDWNKPAIEIDRMVRAFYPWPIAWFTLTEKNGVNEKYIGKKVKIYKAKCWFQAEQGTDIQKDTPYFHLVKGELNGVTDNLSISQIFKHNKSLFIQTSNGILELQEIQLEGKNRMSGKDYLFLLS